MASCGSLHAHSICFIFVDADAHQLPSTAPCKHTVSPQQSNVSQSPWMHLIGKTGLVPRIPKYPPPVPTA